MSAFNNFLEWLGWKATRNKFATASKKSIVLFRLIFESIIYALTTAKHILVSKFNRYFIWRQRFITNSINTSNNHFPMNHPYYRIFNFILMWGYNVVTPEFTSFYPTKRVKMVLLNGNRWKWQFHLGTSKKFFLEFLFWRL